MKSALFKLLPYVVGIGFGILLVNPPDFLRSLGAAAYLVMAVLVALLLLVFMGFLLLSQFPADPKMEPVAGATLPSDLQAHLPQFAQAGFKPAGPTLTVGAAPPSLLLSFVHEHEPIYAGLFRTGTVPARVSYYCSSIFEGKRGGLTTSPEPRGGALPAVPGSLRQFFPKAKLAELLGHHRRALAYLATRGISPRSLDGSTFTEDYRRSFARSRRAFLRRPIFTTLVTAWRIFTRSNPCLGAIAQQASIEQQIREVQTGAVD